MRPLERLASRIPRLELVPERDLILALDPAQVHLAPLAQGGEVDEPAIEVAQHDLHRLELGEPGAQGQEALRHHLPRLAAAVAGRRLRQGVARLLLGELLLRLAQPLDPLADPGQRRVGLLERVVPFVLHAPPSMRARTEAIRRATSSRTRGSTVSSPANSSACSNASRARCRRSPPPLFLSTLSPRSRSVRMRSEGSRSAVTPPRGPRRRSAGAPRAARRRRTRPRAAAPGRPASSARRATCGRARDRRRARPPARTGPPRAPGRAGSRTARGTDPGSPACPARSWCGPRRARR